VTARRRRVVGLVRALAGTIIVSTVPTFTTAPIVVAVTGGIGLGVASSALAQGSDAERERQLVDALRREDPSSADRYVALREARTQAVQNLQRTESEYQAGGAELRPVLLGQLRDAQRKYAETSLALLDFLEERNRRALAGYQQEITRITTILEEYKRTREELGKLLR
jgi:hypothetical protein